MLKHARTNKAKQELQLQRQWQQQPVGEGAIRVVGEQQQSFDEVDGHSLLSSPPSGQFDSLIELAHHRASTLDNNNNGDVGHNPMPLKCPPPIPNQTSTCNSSSSLSPSLLSTPTKLFHLNHHLHHSTSSSTPNSPFSSPQKSSNGYNNTNSSSLLRPKCSSDSMIKVFAQTLSQDVEYVTLHVNTQTKSNQIIKSLLRKFRLKHRDPNLFYLTLERWIRKDGLKSKSVMLLGDEACPLQLQQCCSNPPHNDIKFTLQIRAGSLVKISCNDVVPDAQYKCLSLSTQTTVEETIELMLHCLNLANQTTSTASNTTNSQTHLRLTDSPSSTGSSNSSSSASSNSSTFGLESESNCVTSSANESSTTRINGGSLDSDSRASSVTSISSTSNISTISNSITDQFCLVVESNDKMFRRVLDSDEYVVDVHQNLSTEAKRHLKHVHPHGITNGANINRQHTEQAFFLKLQKRDEQPSNRSLTAIELSNQRQNIPLPPIPPASSRQLFVGFSVNNDLHNFVSTTQIEVSTIRRNCTVHRPSISSLTLQPTVMKDGDLCRLSPVFSQSQRPQQQNTSQLLASASSPPPEQIVLLPPIRPRRKNISNASTFGRPLYASKRRRYDPAQLAEDLNKLDLKELSIPSSPYK